MILRYDAIYLIAYAMLEARNLNPDVFKTKLIEVSKGGDIIGVNKFEEAKAKIDRLVELFLKNH